ncbi:B-cell antigen receptor complex-associated protein beta chain [Plecturocebus cupreus]
MATCWVFSQLSPPTSTLFGSPYKRFHSMRKGGLSPGPGLNLLPVAATLGLLLLKNLCSSHPPQGQLPTWLPALQPRGCAQGPSRCQQEDQRKGTRIPKIWQYPRFIARKRGFTVKIQCHTNGTSSIVSWLRKRKMDEEPQQVNLEQGHMHQTQNGSVTTLIIQDIRFEDNGIYFCQQECINSKGYLGCGTELRVMGFSTLEQLKRRNTLKDSIIMIQTLLIILFIVVPIFLLLDKDDSKAGMEEDHTYEGLNIDQTATYEDIVTLRTGEVKWSVETGPEPENGLGAKGLPAELGKSRGPNWAPEEPREHYSCSTTAPTPGGAPASSLFPRGINNVS